MKSTAELRLEAQEALERVWFVQEAEETERTDSTLSLRLHKPLLKFLARVEDILLAHSLL